MAKKGLEEIKKCPIDFLYLWASDSFISKLGSKAKIIREKKYYQQQTLWRAVVDSNKAKSQAEYQNIYTQWCSVIASAMESVYGLTPEEILHKLAMGEQVAGKDWKAGVYGIGSTDGKLQLTFSQTPGMGVDAGSGKITYQGTELSNQTAIYGADGTITGYYVQHNGAQYQSYGSAGVYGAYTYSTATGVQKADGSAYNAKSGTFWQNIGNYMPLIESIINWIKSLFAGEDRTVLTKQTTVPSQTEWVESGSDNSVLAAGGLLMAGLLLLRKDNKKKKKNK